MGKTGTISLYEIKQKTTVLTVTHYTSKLWYIEISLEESLRTQQTANNEQICASVFSGTPSVSMGCSDLVSPESASLISLFFLPFLSPYF